MSRLLWVGAGAVGGIYLYRKGERVWDEAKDRGIAGNASVLASATSALMSQARARSAQIEGSPAGTEHVIQLPVKDHEPGMVYEVRAIPATPRAPRRAGAAVARLASWRSNSPGKSDSAEDDEAKVSARVTTFHASNQRSSA